jgi:hypothetical protein
MTAATSLGLPGPSRAKRSLNLATSCLSPTITCVRGHDLLPILCRQASDVTIGNDARIVDQHIEAPELVDSLFPDPAPVTMTTSPLNHCMKAA